MTRDRMQTVGFVLPSRVWGIVLELEAANKLVQKARQCILILYEEVVSALKICVQGHVECR